MYDVMHGAIHREQFFEWDDLDNRLSNLRFLVVNCRSSDLTHFIERFS